MTFLGGEITARFCLQRGGVSESAGLENEGFAWEGLQSMTVLVGQQCCQILLAARRCQRERPARK